MNWNERKKILASNGWILFKDVAYIHTGTSKSYSVNDIKRLTEWGFSQLISTRCIYHTPNTFIDSE